MSRDGVVVQLEALQSLLRHPGWDILAEEFKRKAAAEWSGMKAADGPDSLLKHTYSYMILNELPAVPAMLMSVLNQKLQASK